jgi:SAM-dependent methyltransferase
MAIEIKKLFEEWVDPMVLDIASNDGCLLEQFKAQGYYVMGVEPCKELADEANAKKISTINYFFNEESCKRIPALDLITATNVFAHVEDIRTFLNLSKSKLRNLTKGIIVIEVPYLVNLINDNQFDTVYHEHLSYFLLRPLMRLFRECGMEIFKVEEHPIHGGSLRVYGAKIGDRLEHPSVSELEQYEEINGFYSIEKYRDFYVNVKELVGRFKVVVQTLVLDGKKIAGYGASAKGVMFLSASGINSAEIRYVVDDTPEKQGKFIPKSNIPIVDFSMFEKDRPDYIVLMSWNFADELMAKTKHLGCKYIVTVPEVTIL